MKQLLPVDDINAIVHAGKSKALAVEALNEDKEKQISKEIIDDVTATTINNTAAWLWGITRIRQ